MASGKAKVVSEEYKSAIQDLTFNSKPMINVLTMLADENNDYGQVIVQIICERIKEVNIEQKMPALYLLDSILKNIGGEYVPIISKSIVDVFSHVFETALDERLRMQLFKLRNTWNQYIPTKSLYELDVQISRTDRNWPIASPVATVATGGTGNQKIHINPKFLQKSEQPTTSSVPAVPETEDSGAALQSKIHKQRLLEEEKRVQEQLKLLQAEKIKRDREKHEMELKQQQLERERLLAEQKRQLEVLRKQQQSITAAKKASSSQQIQPTQEKAKVARSNTVSDPRRKLTSPTFSDQSKEVRVNTKVASKVPPSKNTSPKAVNVLNKIMTSLSTKKTRPSAQQLARNKKEPFAPKSKTYSTSTAHVASKANSRVIETKNNSHSSITTSRIVSVHSRELSDNSSAKVLMESTDSPAKIKDGSRPSETAGTENTTKTVETSLPKDTPTSETISLETTTAAQTTSVVTTSTTLDSVVLPPTSVFTQFSNREMQIAAQAAAIATAMHQMQSGAPAMAPEQSALIAAQLIKVMQGSIPAIPTALPATSLPAVTSTSSELIPTLAISVTADKKTVSTTGLVVKKESSKVDLKSYKVQDVKKKENSETFKKDKLSVEEKKSRSRSPKLNIDSHSLNQPDPSRSPKRNNKRNETRVSSKRTEKNNEDVRGRNRKNSDSKNNEHVERSRKARARSPSRYYCRVEKKIEVDKRVEKKEKEMVLQRRRKDSGGDKDSVRKLSESFETGDHCEIKLEDDLDDIELPEVGVSNAKAETVLQIKEPSEISAGVKPEKMTEIEWESLQRIRKKEFIILRTRVRDFARQLKENKAPLGPLVIARFKEECQSRFKEGKLSTDQTDHLFQLINKFDNDQLHWQKRPDMRLNPKSNARKGLNKHQEGQSHPRHPHPQQIIGDALQQPHSRDSSPVPHVTDGPRPPHMIDGPPLPHRMDGPRPPHRLDGPQLRPPHIRDGPLPPQHLLPPHMTGGLIPPPHFNGRPQLPNFNDGPIPQNFEDGSRPIQMMDDPRLTLIGDASRSQYPGDGHRPPHEGNGPRPPLLGHGIRPPPHMGHVPRPPHMLDASRPPHFGNRPPPPRMRGPPPPEHVGHMRPRAPIRDGPPNMHDGTYHLLPPHIRDDLPPHMRGHGDLPPHMTNEMHPRMDFHSRTHQDGSAPQILEGLRPPDQLIRPGQDHYFRNSPPPPSMMEQLMTHGPSHQILHEGFNQPTSKSVDVGSLLGQLLAAGMIKKESESPKMLDVDAPFMKLHIDVIRKRHQSVINNLFQGLQCSSCGQRFSEDLRKQYSDHLDWHFRQNRKEKDGVRKVSSRSWYYDVHDWIEHTEASIGEDGRLQSAVFENEMSGKFDDVSTGVSVSESPAKKSKKVKDHSIPVSEDDGDGMCCICLERLEQYWDEDQEEWRYRESIRENNKTYHHHCFSDHIPFEYEDVTSPTKTSDLETSTIEAQSADTSIVEAPIPSAFVESSTDDTVQVTPDVKDATNEKEIKNEDENANNSDTEATHVIKSDDDTVVKTHIKADVEKPSDSHIEAMTIVKKEDEESNMDLPEIESPNSPEFPVIPSTSVIQTVAPNAYVVNNENSLRKKRPPLFPPVNDIPAKEAKLDYEDLYTSFESSDSHIIDKIVKVQPSSNKSD